MDEPSTSTTILKAIHSGGPISRAQLARASRLSPATVSLATKALITAGLIAESGESQEGMGRPAMLLTIREDFALFVGASLTREKMRAVLTNLGGSLLAGGSATLQGSTLEHVVERLHALVRRLQKRAGIDDERVAGLGLALSGLVDSTRGVCVHSTVLGWKEVPVGDALERRFGVPVVIENDANAVAVGERLFGSPHAWDHFVVVSIGQGIGAGIYVDGRLYQGGQGASGEIGHLTLVPGGPECRCGKQGCLEAIASVPAMLAQGRELGLRVARFRDLLRLAQDGNERALGVLSRAGGAIGLALSHVVNLLSPSHIAVTGSGVRLGRTLPEAIRASFEANIFPSLPSAPLLVFRDEGDAVWARGAASIATNAFLEAGGDPTNGRPVGRPPRSSAV